MIKNIVFLLFIFCYFNNSNNLHALDIADKIVYEISSKTAEAMEKKHNIQCIGVKLGGPEKINIIGLRFQIYYKSSKEKFREMLIEGVHEFIKRINQRDDLKKYFVQSFDENNIEIWLYINSEDKSTLYYPDICFAACTKGKISYHTNDPENQFKDKTVEKETYQEALEKLYSFRN